MLQTGSSLGISSSLSHPRSPDPGRALLFFLLRWSGFYFIYFFKSAMDFYLPSTISQKLQSSLLRAFEIFKNQMLHTRFYDCSCWIDRQPVKILKFHLKLTLNLRPLFVCFLSCLNMALFKFILSGFCSEDVLLKFWLVLIQYTSVLFLKCIKVTETL